eukprot:2461517-Amphidinium_carterae.2
MFSVQVVLHSWGRQETKHTPGQVEAEPNPESPQQNSIAPLHCVIPDPSNQPIRSTFAQACLIGDPAQDNFETHPLQV